MNQPSAPTYKRQHAVALSYNESDLIPRVVASGVGEVAKSILKLAQENNIPIKEDQTLTDLLSKLDVGQVISQECFRLVAEILSFLFHADKEWREKHKFIGEIVEPQVIVEE